MFRDWQRLDPGPCPVDDAPHTTCTAPNPAAITSSIGALDQRITVAVQRPGWMREPPPPERSVSAPFTTATYKRKRR